MMEDEVELKNYLEATFGDDLTSLKNIEHIYEQAKKKQESLRKKLTITSSGGTGKLCKVFTEIKGSIKKSEDVQKLKLKHDVKVEEFLEKNRDNVEKILDYLSDVDKIDCYVYYFSWIAKIEETSGEIRQSILSDSMKDACDHFKSFVEMIMLLKKNQTNCHTLVEFLRRTIMFWYNILRDKLGKDFDAMLKTINWPFLSSPGSLNFGGDTLYASSYSLPHLRDVVGNLLTIQLPTFLLKDADVSEEKNLHAFGMYENDVVLLPFHFLLKTLRKRFKYHFVGNKQTNDLHRPEWYLSQVLNWVGNHSSFLENIIQPILDDSAYTHVDAVMMFTRGLLQLVSHKLTVDIREIVYSDDLFTHTVDELLLFDQELRTAYDIPNSLLRQHSPLTVLSEPTYIQKWLTIEKTNAIERLDSLLFDQNWEVETVDGNEGNVNDMKTPKCAEYFITILLTLTDRYKNIPDDKTKLQFLQLQLFLLDDFRIRLTQMIRSIITNPMNNDRFSILNSAFYITIVLKEWADNLFFLDLKSLFDAYSSTDAETNYPVHNISSHGELTNTETVFDSMIELYERICTEGVATLTRIVFSEFKAKCRSYLNEEWMALSEVEEKQVRIVSQSACPMLEVLQVRLFQYEQRLSGALFIHFWKDLAEEIDQHLFTELIMLNHFNAGGAAQLQFDMKRNLFPLFGLYTNRPENYFKRIKESCLLLNLQHGSALLLKEEIVQSLDHSKLGKDQKDKKLQRLTDPNTILADMGIYLIKGENVIEVLKHRIDW